MARFDRRRFLKGAGAATLALPFAGLWGESARAAGGSAPQRLLIFFHENGSVMRSPTFDVNGNPVPEIDEFTPSGTGRNFDLSSGLPAGEGVLSPLAPFQDKLVVVSGLGTPTAELPTGLSGHGKSKVGLLTGVGETPGAPDPNNPRFADGPSIDQVISQRIGNVTPKGPMHTIIGESHVSHDNVVLFAGPGDPVTSREPDPVALYSQLFNGFVDPGDPNADAARAAAEARLRRKRSILDATLENFSSYRRNLGTDGRQRLDAHASYVRDIEQRLALPMNPAPAQGCADPGRPAGADLGQQDVVGNNFADLLTMAFACDLTRVASIHYATTHNYQFPWAGVQVPYENTGHANVHDYMHDVYAFDGIHRTVKRGIIRWHMEQLAYLLNALDSIPEGDGTLLDNTLILSLSDHGDAGAHAHWNLPVVLAGRACGNLDTGRHLAFPGGSNNDLLVSIMNLFGYDDTTFGRADMSSGGLSGLA